jgi:hypothetical protein
MSDPHSGKRDEQGQSEYVKGGKGRKDEVGGSGIYPASSPDAPGDAEVRSEGELARHERRRPERKKE